MLMSVAAVISFSILLYSNYSEGTISLSLQVTEVGSNEVSLLFLVDNQSLVFISMTLFVSSSVMCYCIPYMESDGRKKGFVKIMVAFISSMLILSVSGNLFTMLMGWDGLGLSSFALIVFFQNWSSFNSGVITFLTNRLGDAAIILSLVMISLTVEKELVVWSLLFLLGSITKSAQFPFSAWLPRAMAAPTPVSALVHSSTLVTAGVYSVIRFFPLLSGGNVVLLQWLSILSTLLSCISAMGEYDLKKIIALSTLSHISLMMFCLSMGYSTVAMVHMFIHAVFKSSLFMVAGWLIHLSQGEQDVRRLSMWILPPSGSVLLTLSMASMSGLPFLAGFYSKELVLHSTVMEGQIVTTVLFYVAAMGTCAYSVRMAAYLVKGTPYPLTNSGSYGVSKLFLVNSLSSSILSGLINPAMGLTIIPKSFIFSSESKVVLLSLMVLSVLIGWARLVPSLPIRVTKDLVGKMWQVGSLSELPTTLVRNSSWSLLFHLETKGLLDKLAKSGSLTNLVQAQLWHLAFPNPSSVVKVMLVSVLAIMYMW